MLGSYVTNGCGDARALYRACWRGVQPKDVQFCLFNRLPDYLNGCLASYSPIQLIAGTVIVVIVLRWLERSVSSLRTLVSSQSSGYGPASTAIRVVARLVADLPIIRGFVEKEQEKVISKLREDMKKTRAETGVEPILSLPVKSTKNQKSLLRMIAHKMRTLGETRSKADRMSRASGAVYVGDAELLKTLEEVYSIFSLSNPMHSNIFPTTRQMEAEVIQMTASLVGGGGKGSSICGSMTSGGTESILTAVKASRDYMRKKRRIQRPEMVIAPSAHAAFIKAAEYFNITLVKAPLDGGHRLTARAVRSCLTKNTMLVVASAVNYPHGVMDDVSGIAALCEKRGVLLHVDACLGGFVLPFLQHVDQELGGTKGAKPLEFDFRVRGVTSMSLDSHKFGCSHKGTSIVLYRSPDIRRFQFTSITDWSGGLYISPGFAGSRNGALIATAWASMLYHGLDGYVENTQRMMQCATRFKQAIQYGELAEYLEIIGDPVMSVIAFGSKPGNRNIYVVNDILSRKGWKMSALQSPPGLHMCFTPAHSLQITEELIRDIRCAFLEERGTGGEDGEDEGMAPLYGMAAKVPDKRIVGNFLIAYQDMLLEP